MSMNSRTNPSYRFILNKVAAKVFTFFGLFILVTFAVLIIHLISNSLPLLYSPKINQLESQQALDFDIFIGSTVVAGVPTTLGVRDCEIVRMSQGHLHTKETIRLPCDKQWMPVKHAGNALMVVSLNEAGLIEFYRVQLSEKVFNLRLFGSFYLPKEIGDISTVSPGFWSIELMEQTIHIVGKSANGSAFTLHTTLNSTEKPTVRQYAEDTAYFPLALTDFAILQTGSNTRIIDRNGETLQTLSDNPLEHVVRLPNARGFITFDTSASRYKVFGLYNDAGQFTYNEIAAYESNVVGAPISIDFDRQTGAIFLLTDASEIHIFNPNTFEIVSTHPVTTQADRLQNVDEFVVLNDKKSLTLYEASNMVGVVTWKSLFSPVHYIGYPDAELVWQTSKVSANDQAKFNIVPLIIGSIKASLLALIVAVPLAVGSAVFTAYFATEKARAWLKPGIEMVEALPTVVIGFVAAVWLAPMADKNLIAILLSIASMPFVILVGIFTHSYWSMKRYNFQSPRRFLFGAVALLMVTLFLLFNVGVYLQHLFIDANASWANDLLATMSLSKSTVVVAIALGVAITPSIYSLIDDAINEVPKGAILASFSLGANEVQTLFRVVLVVALPGILSAIMLGFGRAFGETMIVLMVTGNTPVPSWELLDGLRSLTSNLTVELQESNKGSMHFHILFFTAALLFLFTFCVNSFAALFKSRLIYGANSEQ